MKELKDREYENALVWKIIQQSMDIDVLENENTNLQHKIDELEAQLLEIAQSKNIEREPMTDPAGKGVL